MPVGHLDVTVDLNAIPQADLVTCLTGLLMGLVAYFVEKLHFRKGRRDEGA